MNITGTKAMMSTLALTFALRIAPRSDPTAAGTENDSARRQQTCPLRASEPAPTEAATATTMSDAAEAGPTGWSNTYTRTGSARIAPPPPTAPTIKPMTMPNGIARAIKRRARGGGASALGRPVDRQAAGRECEAEDIAPVAVDDRRHVLVLGSDGACEWRR